MMPGDTSTYIDTTPYLFSLTQRKIARKEKVQIGDANTLVTPSGTQVN